MEYAGATNKCGAASGAIGHAYPAVAPVGNPKAMPRIERLTALFEQQLKALDQLSGRFANAVDRLAGVSPREGTAERGVDSPPPASALHRLEGDVSMHERFLGRLHETLQRLEEL